MILSTSDQNKPACAEENNHRVSKRVEVKEAQHCVFVGMSRFVTFAFLRERFALCLYFVCVFLFLHWKHWLRLFAVPRGLFFPFVSNLSPQFSAATCMGFAGCAATSKVLMTNPATKTCIAAICTAAECCVARKRNPPPFFCPPLCAHRQVLYHFSLKIKQACMRQHADKSAPQRQVLSIAFWLIEGIVCASFAARYAYKHLEEGAAVMHSHSVTRWLCFQGQRSIVRFIF